MTTPDPITETGPVAQLVLDESIYPRVVISRQRVTRLADAIRAGVTLPPIIADRASRRVVDGFHRWHAYVQVAGAAAEAPIEWRSYADEAAVFADATAINAAHGEPLSAYDLAHCVQVARRLQIPDDQLPSVLSMTAAKIKTMRAERFAEGPDGQLVLLKRSNRHLASRRLTPEQAAGNIRSDGMTLAYHANQLINALENDLADLTQPGLAATLDRLAALIRDHLGGTAAA